MGVLSVQALTCVQQGMSFHPTVQLSIYLNISTKNAFLKCNKGTPYEREKEEAEGRRRKRGGGEKRGEEEKSRGEEERRGKSRGGERGKGGEGGWQ